MAVAASAAPTTVKHGELQTLFSTMARSRRWM
jgi:hypothetical protein